jgi:DHA1 family tetracycline resistance protein-like MFS transporter
MASFVLSALAVRWESLIALFAARLLAGLFSGNAGTAQASIADMSTEKTKAKNLSLSGVVGGISWIVGPPIGGFLSTKKWVSWFDYTTPFWFLAVLFLLNLIWVHRSFSETYRKKERHDWKQEIKDLAKLSKIPRMPGWLAVCFLFYFGWFFFVLYYPTFFVLKFDFNQETIGYYSAFLSIFWFLGSVAVNRWFGERLNPELSLVSALPIGGVLIWIATWAGSAISWLWVFPLLGLAGTACWVFTMTLISNLSGKENQGKAFGILQSMMSLALFISPLVTGFIASYDENLPMYIGTAVLIGVGLYGMGLYSREKRRA